MNKIIRSSEKKDYDSIYVLLVNSLGYNTDRQELHKRLEKLNEGIYRTLVAEIDGKVAGFVGYCTLEAFEYSGGYIKILALATDVKYQKTGVGTALLGAVEHHARNKGIPVITLNSGMQRLDVHGFYEKRGYQKYSLGFKKIL
ncbi:MAG: GNAT family N-acetyltransferase [Oscillospiraceae bacterium]|nr:GNAT family N-acetyltransferase [Oscillospiraceae bacterium]